VGSPEITLNPGALNMSQYDNDRLCSLRAALLDHPIYTQVASVADLRRFMEDHVFAVWDFMSLLKRLQQDMTCITVPWFPTDDAKAARLINDIVIGEETDVGPDGSYMSHLALYLRAMRDIGASTRQFEKFRSLVLVGVPVEAALTRIGAPPHVQAFVAHTMRLANTGSTEEVLAAFFYGREDIIPEMFRRLLDTLYGAKHDSDRLRHFITTSIGISNSMATVMAPWGASCSKIWSRTRRMGESGPCEPRATASRPGSGFGTAHWTNSATAVAWSAQSRHTPPTDRRGRTTMVRRIAQSRQSGGPRPLPL
jgi:DUF3050 family protein